MLLLCGGLRTDYIITATNQVRLMQMGGNTTFGAVGARLSSPDERIVMLGRVGDNWPETWTANLQRAGFLTEGIHNIGGQQDLRTFYAYVDVNTRDDTNPAAHFARLGLPLPPALQGYMNSTPGQGDPYRYEPLAVTPDDFERCLNLLSQRFDAAEAVPKGFHIAPIGFPTQLNLPQLARQRGVNLISVDPGERNMWPTLRPHIEGMLGQIDVFLPSDQEVVRFFPDDHADPLANAQWFAARGPRWVVIKLGSNGCLIYERESSRRAARQWHVPAVTVPVVDVTGAGDTFCGAFMADFITRGDPVRAAIQGAVAASFCIQDYGALHMLEADAGEMARRAAALSALVREL